MGHLFKSLVIIKSIVAETTEAWYLVHQRIEYFASEYSTMTSLSHRLIVAHRVKMFRSSRLICGPLLISELDQGYSNIAQK